MIRPANYVQIQLISVFSVRVLKFVIVAISMRRENQSKANVYA